MTKEKAQKILDEATGQARKEFVATYTKQEQDDMPMAQFMKVWAQMRDRAIVEQLTHRA